MCGSVSRKATFLLSSSAPVELRVDTNSALALMKNPVIHERSKHIRVHYHHVWQCVKEGNILAVFISSKEQLADIGTRH
jgi:hypothetical protein